MNVGIIGCGASGMIASISASKKGHKVTILEKNDKPGKKLLSTGNGKCNFTNEDIKPDYYNECARELFEKIYNSFDKNDVISLFEKIGISSYCKNGYVYPRSEQAASVVNCLKAELNNRNINVIYNCKIDSISYDGKFNVYTADNTYVFDKLIIAAGSNAIPKSGSDGSGYGYAIRLGHKVKKPLPSLCGLKCTGVNFKIISGVRCQARVTLKSDGEPIKSDMGELQITDYGVSGIPVFQISGEAIRFLDEGHDVRVCVDYAPDYEYEKLVEYLNNRLANINNKPIDEFLDGFINNKLAIMVKQEIESNSNLSFDSITDSNIIQKIADVLKNSEYIVKGHRGFDNCQVCSGGIYIDDLKATLESKICPGLYFAGEIIDVNGDCGGYNLQWAWSSGYVAGLLQ